MIELQRINGKTSNWINILNISTAVKLNLVWLQRKQQNHGELFFELILMYNQPPTLNLRATFSPRTLTPDYRIRTCMFCLLFFLVSFLNTHTARDVM